MRIEDSRPTPTAARPRSPGPSPNELARAVEGYANVTRMPGVPPIEQPPRVDRASFRGVPEAELTPAVREAFGSLLSEIKQLRGERDRLMERLRSAEDLADSDTLAPVFNRRAFMRELGRIMSFSERYDVPASVVFFDLDGFKQINDRHGHAAGDLVLATVADVLRSNVRESDVVGRVGGDEFAVVLAKTDTDLARAKGAALVDAIRAAPITFQGVRLRAGASFGAYQFEPGATPEQALARADEAMYADKIGRRTASL